MFKNENTEKNYLKINLPKSFVIGENKDAILFAIKKDDTTDNYMFWINKKGVFYSNYSNILNVSLIDFKDFQYSIYKLSNRNWKTPDNMVSGKILFDNLMKNEIISLLNRK